MPKALLLDEPLAALDLKLRQTMQFELKRIQREVGITFIFVTHDQHEAITMSDRIAVMSQGRVEQIGSPEEIYNTPATNFVASFIGDANLLKGEVISSDASGADIKIGSDVIRSESLADNVSAGQTVTVMIRPERVLLNPVDSIQESISSQNGGYINCTVVNHTFQGAQSRYSLQTSDGQNVFAYIDWTDELPEQESGAVVQLSCDKKVVRTFG
jgi:spermidine/putrescine transport system ATP-binding protein